MNAALGFGGVVLGVVGCLGAIVTLAIGLKNHRSDLLRMSRTYAFMILGAAVLSFIAMERALITRDFSLKFVATNGSSATPALYNFASLWSALEGSILLWTLILAGYTVAVALKFRKRLSDPLVGWAMLTMFVVALFFFGLMLGPANPFKTLAVPPLDGPGPNPLLQNHPLMAFHPPMLYLGYVGFTVPFAFAIAALTTGRLGEGWLVETRRWTLFAWSFLTIGIVLGAWWSHEVLGWGGYWAWDPVENASFLPWLTGTAFIHSVMVQERRGMLRVWNLSLLCATFSLTILGTFLTRSGVLDSVHAFSDSTIGPALLTFFGLIVAVTVGLIAWRGDRLRSPARIDSPASREGAFLLNNIVFAAFAFVVLLGTVFPLIAEALNGDRVTVGVPYFERMTMPIGIVLLFLMAVAPVLPWRKASAETLRTRLLWPGWVGTGALLLALLLGARGFSPLLAFFLAGFAAGSALRQLVLATRRQGVHGLLGRTNGGMIVHLGVIMLAVAFTASNAYQSEREARMCVTAKEGCPSTITMAGHDITYLGPVDLSTAARSQISARLLIDGKVYRPGIQQFPNGNQQIGKPTVRNSPQDSLLIALLNLPSGSGDTSSVQIRAVHQPLIIWLWTGGAIMAFGSLLAAFPGKRRNPTDPVSAPIAAGGPPPPDPDPDPDRVPVGAGA
ncbi:heme lyase CcmF/NrfE family subunit [Aquihabitans daechungensis]|uniref:heme lyase CcmF/NrfE family subunit n=1 Tax=Aquihabitans daechungensis TaxID=1052257 RepID=UPI003BA17293